MSAAENNEQPQETQDEAAAGLQLAEELLAAGDTARAAEAYLYAAGILASRGQQIEAVGFGYRALQLDPKAFARLIGSDPLLSLGPAAVPVLHKALAGFETERKWAEAAMVGRKLVALDPENVDLRLRVSNALAELSLADEALDLLWELVPPLERDGNNGVLLELLPRVLELKPDHSGAHRRLMRVYLRVGELRACVETLTPLAKADDPDALEVLARVQTELGRDDLALALLRRLSFVLIERGELERADRLLSVAGRWSINDVEFHAKVTRLRADVEGGGLDRATTMRGDVVETALALGAQVVEVELGIGAAIDETPNP